MGHAPVRAGNVSIPFTSGHVFRHEVAALKATDELVSQSLLHQVTYSDYVGPYGPTVRLCLNPFYIRSRIPTRGYFNLWFISKRYVSIPFTSGHVFRHCLIIGPSNKVTVSQSLLHQVTYSDVIGMVKWWYPEGVSIPFTSGHVFRRALLVLFADEIGDVSIPFTSGHVFRPTPATPATPATKVSQSLLHQVTYSDSRSPGPQTQKTDVSIPFTSGHVFRLGVAGMFAYWEYVSQSLLHQVTYSDTVIGIVIGIVIGVSQSLLH